MNPEEIDALLALPKGSEHVEFKEAKGNSHFDRLVSYCLALVDEWGAVLWVCRIDRHAGQSESEPSSFRLAPAVACTRVCRSRCFVKK